jgi:hypothetical protein
MWWMVVVRVVVMVCSDWVNVNHITNRSSSSERNNRRVGACNQSLQAALPEKATTQRNDTNQDRTMITDSLATANGNGKRSKRQWQQPAETETAQTTAANNGYQ